ncbi:hypothetical protein B23_3808 [Geobacillus thermoleovorans B23]|nr:hypothetical protein B23_3808 [Geobacillus thermoleovorans B23]
MIFYKTKSVYDLFFYFSLKYQYFLTKSFLMILVFYVKLNI